MAAHCIIPPKYKIHIIFTNKMYTIYNFQTDTWITKSKEDDVTEDIIELTIPYFDKNIDMITYYCSSELNQDMFTVLCNDLITNISFIIDKYIDSFLESYPFYSTVNFNMLFLEFEDMTSQTEEYLHILNNVYSYSNM